MFKHALILALLAPVLLGAGPATLPPEAAHYAWEFNAPDKKNNKEAAPVLVLDEAEIPIVYVGETPADHVLHVPLEFYVSGRHLNIDFDHLGLDYVNLTPEIARRIPAQQPQNGFTIDPHPD